MVFTQDKVTNEEIKTINQYFDSFESSVTPEKIQEEKAVAKYITSLTTSFYAKSVEDIENTVVGSNRLKRKRSFQQIMEQSFFYGANRFGNNFIA